LLLLNFGSFSMEKSPRLYFIALLPPAELQAEVTAIKQDFADRYGSSHALKSPPHVTLQAPFKWVEEDLDRLTEPLRQFARFHDPISIALSGFGAFPPRVIYIDVEKTPELLQVQAELALDLERRLGIVDDRARGRAFSPHMTVAFKDLKRQAFKAAWPEFRDLPFAAQFTVSELTLLLHRDRQWHIYTQFPLEGEENHNA
jgi:2'-5' RNA ligase